MKKYLFLGGTDGNTGPSNVNRNIIANLTNSFRYVKSNNRYFKYIEAFYKMMLSEVIVISGISKLNSLIVSVAKKLNKKIIYIMHGCYEIETNLNGFQINDKSLRIEKNILELSDLILPVSKRYSEVIKNKYPQYKDKISYLYNGVSLELKKEYEKENRPNDVIAVGGDRKLKNNLSVANAMNKIDQNKVLNVYGYIYEPDNLPKSDNICFHGLVTQNELYEKMRNTKLFVQNSIYEPFSLSIFDALICGCSILVSNIVGALDLLDVNDNDIIFNPFDEEEISKKIDYLLSNPNNKRILEKLDLNKLSYEQEVKKLEKRCNEISGKE